MSTVSWTDNNIYQLRSRNPAVYKYGSGIYPYYDVRFGEQTVGWYNSAHNDPIGYNSTYGSYCSVIGGFGYGSYNGDGNT